MARLLVGNSGASAIWTGQFIRGSARVRTDDVGRSGPLVVMVPSLGHMA